MHDVQGTPDGKLLLDGICPHLITFEKVGAGLVDQNRHNYVVFYGQVVQSGSSRKVDGDRIPLVAIGDERIGPDAMIVAIIGDEELI